MLFILNDDGIHRTNILLVRGIRRNFYFDVEIPGHLFKILITLSFLPDPFCCHCDEYFKKRHDILEFKVQFHEKKHLLF